MANNEIPHTGIEGIARSSDLTNLGDERFQDSTEISTTDRISTLYDLNTRTLYNYLDEIESRQQAWTRNQVLQKGNETSRARRIGCALAETIVPIAAGTATDALLGAAGVAGGPLVAAAVGAASGAARAAMEYRHVGKEGENAAEFWQKNVGDKDRKTREGNFLRRGWGHISRFLKGGSYLGAEHGFKVKQRDRDIKRIMDSLNIQTDANEETLTGATTVFNKLEQLYVQRPQEYEQFVKNMMTQSVLSNFSEQKTLIEQKQMSDLFCIANAVLYKNDLDRDTEYQSYYSQYGGAYRNPTYGGPNYATYNLSYNAPSYAGYPGYPNSANDPATVTINRLWNEATNDVKEIVARTKTSFIIGAAAERAIKSTVGFFAMKWVADGIDKIKDLKEAEIQNSNDIENSKSLIASNNSEIKNVNKDISSLKTQINELDLSPQKENLSIDYKAILDPAAKASGQDVLAYLSIQERASIIEDLPEISQAVNDPETLDAIMSLSNNLGKTPAEILHSGMLRWVYDKDRYSSIGELFQQALDPSGTAILSIDQALGASNRTHPAWRELADAILNNTTSSSNSNMDLLQSLQEQLLGKEDILSNLLSEKENTLNLLSLQNNDTARILSDIKKGVWETSKRGIIAATGAIADIASGSQRADFIYGEKDNPQNNYSTGYNTYGTYPTSPRSLRQNIASSTTPDNANFPRERINNSVITRLSMSEGNSSRFIRLPRSGFNKTGWRDQGKIREDASQIYLNNPTGKTSEILDDYFLKQNNKHTPSYRNIISTNASNIGPIKQDCKISIAIPALGEETSIRHTLEQFAKLDGKEQFELCILDTHPKNSTDRTEDIVREFMNQNPNLSIVYIKREVGRNTNVGESRKFLNDVILERVRQIDDESRKENYIIVSQDADLQTFEHKNYIKNIIKTFNNNSNLEVLNGRSNLTTEALAQAPAVHAAWKTWSVFDETTDQETNTVNKTIGNNSAIKARTLAGIGGYNPYLEVAEDLDIGWKVNNLKGNDKISRSNSFGLEGEARRAFVAHLNKIPIIHMYNRFHDNKGLRGKSWTEILRDNPNAFDFTIEKYTREVQALYQHCMSTGISFNIFDKTMKKLGVNYTISNNIVKIDQTSIPSIERVLEKERIRFQKLQKQRPNNP